MNNQNREYFLNSDGFIKGGSPYKAI